MRLKRRLYAAHRWVGLIVGLQLLAWSLGGFMFSVLDLDSVRGDTDRAEIEVNRLDIPDGIIDAHHALEQWHMRQQGAEDIIEIRLRERIDRLVYELVGAGGVVGALDATTGQPVGQLTASEAKNIASRDFAPGASPNTVDLISADPPLEYRGKPLPAYRVVLDHPKEPHIYVSAITGQVTARRNARWRVFDFFWMLHVMDYQHREDFNHPLLTGMSALAILSALSGLGLWGWRFGRRLRRAGAGTSD